MTIRLRALYLSCAALFLASVQAQDPEITEFLAVNNSVLADGDGAFSDWIEIHNPGGVAIDLDGWHLTDSAQDLIRWTFPANSMVAAGGYEIVFASGNPSPPAGEWHASFSLDGNGEYLALVKPDGVTVASEFAPMYPEQRTDISYGLAGGGALNFFTSPTPGAANGSGVLGFVGDTQFSHKRGFYDAPFDLTITATEPGSAIRYTLDGSEPSPSNGNTYSTPIPITTTTLVRAMATKSGYLPTDIDTQTYLFVADVLEQPVTISGFPNISYSLGTGGNRTRDCAMDLEIVDDAAYSGMIDQAMRAIPSMSIVLPQGDIFGGSGFYDTNDIEAATSIEVLYADTPLENEQVDGAIEGHSHIRMKRSMRLNFSSAVGDPSFKTKLFDRLPWNPPSISGHDRLVLRGGNNRAWSRGWAGDKVTYCLDELARQTQLATSGYGIRGAFVHLYLNGVYWGLFNVVERADEHFTSAYLGGEPEDWFAVSHGGDISGVDDRYDYLKGTLKNKDMAVAANYAELGEYLDIEGFIDYLCVQWYPATGDWPNNNWYAGHRSPSSSLGPTPMRYFAWDGEWSWDLPRPANSNSFPYDPWVHSDFRASRTKNQGGTIAQIFNSAKDNDDFMRVFADRVYRHCFNGGPMSDAVMLARLTELTDHIRDAVVGESARWGDTVNANAPYTRDEHWQDEVDAISALITKPEAASDLGRAERFIAALRGEDYYPSIDPPTFNQRGGTVILPFSLMLNNPNAGGSIRYTIDGSDPADGGALTYSSPLPITESQQIRTRVLSSGEWSALDEATFVVPGPPALRISELMYHPTPPSAAEITAGFTDQDDFEFIELHNRGTEMIELEGITFTNGVTFTFPAHSLAAGARVLVVSNPAAFAMRYGASATVLGSYDPTRLANGGERLRLESALGVTIADLTYGDSDPWPQEADGGGQSLVLIEGTPGTNPSLAGNWRASALPGGSVGAADTLVFSQWAAFHLGGQPAADQLPLADPDFDDIVNLIEYAFDLNPLVADAEKMPSVAKAADQMALDYERDLFKTDLSITAEAADSPGGTWSDSEVSDSAVSTVAESEQRRASVSTSGVEQLFMRLRLSLQ